MDRVWKYLKNNLIAIDQAVNTAFGGDPDETISSRLGKARNTSRAAAFFADIVDKLFFWDPNHCKKSEEPNAGDDSVI